MTEWSKFEFMVRNLTCLPDNTTGPCRKYGERALERARIANNRGFAFPSGWRSLGR